MSKIFTLPEAEELLPRLEKWLSQAIEAKNEAVTAERELQVLNARIQMMGGIELEPASVAQMKRDRSHAMNLVQEALKQIEESGCVVKDLDVGLIDFPAILHDEQVYLCWKLGETRIEYWHRTDEGFAGRKPIAGEFEGGAPDRPN